MKQLVALVALLLSVNAAVGGEWVVGAGYTSFGNSGASNSMLISAELHGNPFFSGERFRFSYAGAADAHTSGDVFLGAGLSATADLSNRWYLEASILPGVFFANDSSNDLGSTFEIRSLVGLGYRLRTDDSLSLAVMHKSNAGTAPKNPGVNAVFLRYRRGF